MNRSKLLSHINYALNHIQYGEEREKEIKKAFKKLKQDLKKFAHENASLHTKVESLHSENETLKQDLEILEILRNHLYVASGLVELKITSQQYANIHKVKYHNGIPIVNQAAIDKINEWYYRRK